MKAAAMRLHFRPHIELLTSARRFVSDFYRHVLGDPDDVSRVAIATHELLENVIKYSSDGCGALEIALEDATPGDVIRIRASNRTTPERAGVLRALVAELEAARDPQALYVTMMRRSASRDEGSGLGLVRIRAETDMQVRCEVEGDHVTIVLEGPVTSHQPKATVSP